MIIIFTNKLPRLFYSQQWLVADYLFVYYVGTRGISVGVFNNGSSN